MSFLGKLLGRRLPSPKGEKQELTVATGVPALGLDAFSSIAYGPEAALTILLPLGLAGLKYFLPISIIIIILLTILYFSYRQTIAAYPSGGGSYIVASDNFGKSVGLWAGVALLWDYLLNVAVGIAAGVGTLVSAIPALQPYTLGLCLLVLLGLTIVNLRGSRMPGSIFLFPLLLFALCLISLISFAFFKLFQGNSELVYALAPPLLPPATKSVGLWILLGALANGLTAMTGIEAVSNAVPIFKKPMVRNAQRTLSIIVFFLALMLAALAFLIPAYHIGAMNELKPGYQTVLSQLIAAVAGQGVFYYISIASIFIVLTFSAQTSFIDFPRVCRLLAEDAFMPSFFAERGRRLVFSNGIIVLALISGTLLIIFKGITYLLIPLFAVGAFSAFFLSQAGMLMHWRKKGLKEHWPQFLVNGFGALATAIALFIIISEKFVEGAWIVVIFAPLTVFLFQRIKKHYQKIQKIIDKPFNLSHSESNETAVVIPIDGLNHKTERALQIALSMSKDIVAVHLSFKTKADEENLRKLWKEKVEDNAPLGLCIPQLEIIQSPSRALYRPIINYVKKIRQQKPHHLIAVLIPELIEPHWYEYLLHSVRAEALRALLLIEGDEQIIVVNVPWHLPGK